MKTFLLEELDEETQNYLLAVRDKQGKGMPGVYAPRNQIWSGCGCVCGLFVVIGTLVLTLTDIADVVFNDPNRVALLQTAGLVLGGWTAGSSASRTPTPPRSRSRWRCAPPSIRAGRGREASAYPGRDVGA